MPCVQPQKRACLKCHLIQTYAQFEKNGCPNCERNQPFDVASHAVNNYTTPEFHGIDVRLIPHFRAVNNEVLMKVAGDYAMYVRKPKASTWLKVKY